MQKIKDMPAQKPKSIGASGIATANAAAGIAQAGQETESFSIDNENELVDLEVINAVFLCVDSNGEFLI